MLTAASPVAAHPMYSLRLSTTLSACVPVAWLTLQARQACSECLLHAHACQHTSCWSNSPACGRALEGSLGGDDLVGAVGWERQLQRKGTVCGLGGQHNTLLHQLPTNCSLLIGDLCCGVSTPDTHINFVGHAWAHSVNNRALHKLNH